MTTLLVTVPAQAAPGDAVAAGNAGSVSIKHGDQVVTMAPIAPCESDGVLSGSVGDASVPKVASFTNSTSACTVDELGEVATAEVKGGAFRLDALNRYGGPRIRLTSYSVKCGTTLTGSSSSMELKSLTGVKIPAQLPANHVVTVPGATSAAPPIATVTFNEMITPSPADGSMTVHAMHVRLFPQGGPASGDAYVGTVHCAPVD
jgi:hypothetical protein